MRMNNHFCLLHPPPIFTPTSNILYATANGKCMHIYRALCIPVQ